VKENILPPRVSYLI